MSVKHKGVTKEKTYKAIKLSENTQINHREHEWDQSLSQIKYDSVMVVWMVR